MNNRRRLLLALGTAALASPLSSVAQPATKVWRVGFLYQGSRQSALETGRYGAFLKGMSELGYIEGRNLAIEGRYSDGKAEHLPGLAAELLGAKVDVIVATGTPAYSALQKATSTMPVVITVGGDPVAEGFAASLARPGGNITGLVNIATDTVTKSLDLLANAVPKLSRVAVLLHPDNGGHPEQLRRIEAAAQKMRVNISRMGAKTPEDIERDFAAMTRERVQAVIVLNDGFLVQQSQQIALLAIKHRLPTISGTQEYPKAGGLMGYGPDIADNFRRAATFVDKIFKGAKPGEIPIEQPTRFYLTINHNTAKALGLKIPQSLLISADKVIE